MQINNVSVDLRLLSNEQGLLYSSNSQGYQIIPEVPSFFSC